MRQLTGALVKDHKTAWLWGLGALLLGLLATLWVVELDRRDIQRELQQALAVQARFHADQVGQVLDHYHAGLRGLRGAVLAADPHRQRQQVERYSQVQRLSVDFPGARGFGFVRRVPAGGEDAFVAAIRAEGDQNFTIKTLGPHSGDRFIIETVQPKLSNRDAIGLDISSEINRRSAAIAAAELGEPQLTAPIKLVQVTAEARQSFLLLLPIYEAGQMPPAREARLERTIGWAYVPLMMDEVLAGMEGDAAGTRLTIADITDNPNAEPFYHFDGEQSEGAPLATHTIQRTLDGRRWQMVFEAMPGFAVRHSGPSPVWVGAVGLLLSALLGALVHAMAMQRRRHAQAQRQRANLEAVVESSADGIIGKTLDGVVTSWNRAAEQLFGYSAEQAIGKRLLELVFPAEYVHEEAEVLERIGRGEHVPYFETIRQRADGSRVDVQVSVSPILDPGGKVIGASKTVRDITEQKAARKQILALNARLESQVAERTQELRRSNSLLKGVMTAASEVAIIATDNHGMITLFNSGAERLLGYREAEVVGKITPAAFHVEEEVQARTAELRELLGVELEGFGVFVEIALREGAETREWTFADKHGGRHLVSLSVTAIRDGEGALLGFLGMAIDVSERKEAERALSRSLATTRAILDTAVSPIITIDSLGTVRSFNPAGERVFGYPASEVVGQNIKMLMPSRYADEHDGYLTRYRSVGDDQPTIGIGREVTARRKDGSEFPIEISLGAMWVEGERLVVGIIADITERHRQQRALARAYEQVTMATKAAELGVWEWNPNDGSVECNDRMWQLYQWPESMRERGVTYDDWRERIHPDDVARVEAELRAARDGLGEYAPVFRIVLPDGQTRHIQAGSHTEFDDAGQAIRMIGINRDITEQLELERDLRQAKAKADQASQAKSAFLANMSHEIRTPMNAVLGMLQLLERSALSERQLDYVNKAHGAGKSLLFLLNDILDYSKIEAGKLQLDPHPFSLDELLRNLSVVLSAGLGGKDIDLVYRIAPDVPLQMIGDSLRLNQVLINLAGNAIKFTHQGHVSVGVSVASRNGDALHLLVEVVDTGIGISQEKLGTIFQGFSQAEASISRRYGGTGLGLVISQRLIALMGGELKVSSEQGKGSRFWFEAALNADTSALPRCPEAAPRRVLVVDDSAVIRQALLAALHPMNWRVEAVADGESAIKVCRQALGADDAFDVVLLDWRLPGMDGVATAECIRGLYPPGEKPRCVAISGYSRELLEAEEQIGDAWPFDDHVIKPVTTSQLVEVLGGAYPAAKPTEMPAPGHSLDGLRVLVVEDNPLNREIAAGLLGSEGANVELAEGGLEGVAAVLRGEPEFDVVLMDMQMPDIDGLEATRRIRGDARFEGLPILAMTANVSSEDVLACLSAGMNDHLSKPLDLRKLVQALANACPQQVVATQSNSFAVAEQADEPVDEPEFEPLSSVLARFGGNQRLLAKMLEQFGGDADELMSKAQSAQREGRTDIVTAAMHALKGTSSTMGALAVARRAGDIERRLRDGGSTGPEELGQLDKMLREAWRALCAHADIKLGSEHEQGDSATTLNQLAEQLQELEPLLIGSDLRALDVVTEMPPAVDGAAASDYVKFIAQVNGLEFRAARDTLRSLLERLT